MIKFIVAALWICAVTVGSVFYSFQTAGERKEETSKPMLGGLDYVSTNMISVPVIRDSAVQGYFLSKLVYTVEPAEAAKLSVPAPALITDEVYSYLYDNPQIDFTQTATLDLDGFRNGLRDAINRRIGTQLVHDVLIDQVSYLSQDEIRDNAIRRRKSGASAAKDAGAGTPAAPATTE
ncbi:hypothetical protein [Mesorhizobium sp. SP-1A]|uniref:hypothetical protein n=1 Tax=Mesorhizobium sp. SP-1A TaxID=3077840 RepID=UPI0028F72F1A|nr:hypothetical protein [Mesorhizobium sp. SP-1A]